LNKEDGQYKLSVVELLGIQDLSRMVGQFAKFFLSPRILNGRLDGPSPKARFILNSNGVNVPSDDSTMQMATIYAHLQRLAALDKELGADGVNKWPRDVGLAVRVSGGLRNNAFYEGKTDSMLVVPYTKNNIPISVNGGILAHEHFHSLFYKLVLKEDTASVHTQEIKDVIGGDFAQTLSGQETPRIPKGDSLSEYDVHYFYHVAITRGLNEGIADFWGWMYTGDPDFIVQSLPEATDRNLKVSEFQASRVLSREEDIKEEIKRRYSFSNENNMDFNSLINGYAYMLGTEFSRSLKRYTDLYADAHKLDSVAARKEVAKIVIKMLPTLKLELGETQREDEKGLKNLQKNFTAKTFIESFVKNTTLISSEECEYLATLMTKAQPRSTGTVNECKQQDEHWTIVARISAPDETPVKSEPSKVEFR
jgi:hypothetical protein